MSYLFKIPDSFKKTAKKKPKQMQERIAECITLLVENPRNPRLNSHKMKGTSGIWECYVDRDGNRVTFEYSADRKTIILRNNCNHDMLYRNP
ncbi:hypothetical protein CIK74_14665 [Glutamicibacter sp. BW77]|nr:hypothetical protein CIK74_14665 [Glutamicibacter sp. BW77]